MKDVWTKPEHWADADHFAYVRKSLVLGEEDRISEVKQRAAIDGDTQTEGLPTPLYFSDVQGHRSGRYEHTRPGWRQVKARFLASPKAILTVFELDRSNRNVLAMAELIETVRTKPGRYRIRLLKNRFDSMRDGWTARELRDLHNDAVAAQYESDVAADRVRDMIRTLQANLVPWGTTPYGLLRVGRGMKAKWAAGKHSGQVAEALRLWSTAGMSYATVARTLNERGAYYYKTRTSADGVKSELPGVWHADRVRQLVGNVMKYAGFIIPNGGRSKARKVKLDGSGPMVEQYARAYGAKRTPAIEPIVTLDIAEAVLTKKLGAQLRGRKPAADIWYPLLCGVATYKGKPLRTQRQGEIHYYRSRNVRPAVSWHAEVIEDQLLRNLRGIRFPPEIVSDLRAELARRISDDVRTAAADTVKKMTGAVLDLERKSALGEIDTSSYLQLKQEFITAIANAERILHAPSAVDRAIDALTGLGEVLTRGKPAARWQAVHAMFESVEINAAGEIERMTPRPWAREAFGQLAFSWRSVGYAKNIPNVTPTGVASSIGISPDDALAWALFRIDVAPIPSGK